MAESWQSVTLAELVDVEHGWPFKSKFCSEELSGEPIVINIGNFRYEGGFRFESTRTREYRGEYPPEYELEAGDILIIMTCQTPGGEILGIPARVPDDDRIYLHNQRLGKVVVKKHDLVDEGFLFWLFQWSEFNRDLYSSASGTKILHTSPTRIRDFRFDLPPLPEQRAIARVLGALDDKIELNREMNRTLEATAQALFKSWFVDFDPVVAKADGRKPYGMSEEIAALFPDRFVESELGPIPEGWDTSTIGQEVVAVGGSTPSTKEPEFWDDGEIPWATPRDLSGQAHSVLLSTDRSITERGLEKISSGLLPRGTVLMSSRAPVGYLAIAEISLAINQGFIAMRCQGRLKNYYILHWAREEMSKIEARASGTTFAEISKRNFRPIPITVPPEPLHAVWHDLARKLHSQVVQNIRESQTLANLRDLLLPKLLSGEIRVGEAEEAVEAAGA